MGGMPEYSSDCAFDRDPDGKLAAFHGPGASPDCEAAIAAAESALAGAETPRAALATPEVRP